MQLLQMALVLPVVLLAMLLLVWRLCLPAWAVWLLLWGMLLLLLLLLLPLLLPLLLALLVPLLLLLRAILLLLPLPLLLLLSRLLLPWGQVAVGWRHCGPLAVQCQALSHCQGSPEGTGLCELDECNAGAAPTIVHHQPQPPYWPCRNKAGQGRSKAGQAREQSVERCGAAAGSPETQPRCDNASQIVSWLPRPWPSPAALNTCTSWSALVSQDSPRTYMGRQSSRRSQHI